MIAKRIPESQRSAGRASKARKRSKPTRRTSAGKLRKLPAALEPTDAQISERAYYLSLGRHGHGSPLDDWLQAEQELRDMLQRK